MPTRTAGAASSAAAPASVACGSPATRVTIAGVAWGPVAAGARTWGRAVDVPGADADAGDMSSPTKSERICAFVKVRSPALKSNLPVVGLMLLPGLAVTAFGLTSLLSALGEGFEPIRRVGVAYLVYLGVMQWRPPPPNRRQGLLSPWLPRAVYGRGGMAMLLHNTGSKNGRVLDEHLVALFAFRERQAAGHQHIADVGESQALPGVLLHQQNGPALASLQIVKDLEDHVDVARLQCNGGLVDQEQSFRRAGEAVFNAARDVGVDRDLEVV